MGDEIGERETLISRKGPHLTTRRRNTRDCADHGEQDEDSRHERSRRDGPGRIVQDLHNGDASLRRGGKTEDIILPVRTETEAQRDEHEQAQERVEKGPPHHRRRQDARRISEFLAHMGTGVGAEEAPQRSRDAD